MLTVSDGVDSGTRDDLSGELLAAQALAAGHEVVWRGVLPDERDEIAACLARLCDEDAADVVLSTGGTGFAPRDVTPEATRAVIDREAPGYAETIRAESLKHTPLGILTRGVSGIRGRTLVINFPGSPKAIGQSWPVVEPTLKHAAATLERE